MTETSETTTGESASHATSNEPAWYLDDNTPGQGPRPDWLPEKYKKVSDLGKSYIEAQKKLGGFSGAPEKYDLETLEVDENDPTIQTLVDIGKKHNMNQSVMAEIVGRLTSIQETTEQMNIEQEVKKLGADGQRMLTEYKNWVNDYVPAPEREAVTGWIKNADDLKAFNRIMAHTHMSQVPTHQTMNMANRFEGVAELRQELAKNLKKFQEDKTYAKDWQNRMANAVQRNPNG